MGRPLTSSSLPCQRGFAVVAAIFLLVVLSSLGAFMLSISTTQQAGQILDLQGARAYQAARAGIEWGVFRVMDPENQNANLLPPGPYTAPYACPGSPITLAPLAGVLAGFTVTVACGFSDHDDGGFRKRVYTLTSTASRGQVANPDFIERQLTVTLSTCRQPADNSPCLE